LYYFYTNYIYYFFILIQLCLNVLCGVQIKVFFEYKHTFTQGIFYEGFFTNNFRIIGV